MKDTTFYWLPNCSTCQKANRRLDRHNVKVTNFRDIKENPLSREEVEKLVKMLGGASELFSKRAVKYREMKLGERDLSEEEMIDLMAEDYTFLKRPILVVRRQSVGRVLRKIFRPFFERKLS